MQRSGRQGAYDIIRCLGFLVIVSMACSARAWPSQLERALEEAFGKLTADGMAAQYGLVEDPTLLGWVEGIGSDVAAVSSRKGVQYHFQILDTDEANAFAAPDGYIFVTAGLLRSVSSDEELAAILGHEVTHVSEKHFTDILLPELAILAGLSTIKDPAYRDAVIATRLSTALLMLRWSRKNEAQADEKGMWYAFRAGYDPRGMVQFLHKLLPGKPASSFAMILETHPDPYKRYERASAHPVLDQDYSTLLAIGDALAARSHLRDAIARYEAAAALRPEDPEPQLRLAAALQRRGQFEEALAGYEKALALDPNCDAARDPLDLLRTRDETPEGPPADAATRGQLRKAIATCAPAIETAPEELQPDLNALAGNLDAIAQDRSTNEIMQKTLVLRPKYEDAKWLCLLYEVQILIVDSRCAHKRLSEVRRLGPQVLQDFSSAHSKLSVAAERSLTQKQADDLVRLAEDLSYSAAIARSEVRSSVARAVEASRKLRQGVNTLTPALFDLNSPFDTDRRLQYSRWAILEGAVARARHAVSQAAEGGTNASSTTAAAAARNQRIQINLLGVLASPSQERIFTQLLAQRLQCEAATIAGLRHEGRLLGDAATMVVTARASSTPVQDLAADAATERTDQAAREGVNMTALHAILRMAANDLQAERTPIRRPTDGPEGPRLSGSPLRHPTPMGDWGG